MQIQSREGIIERLDLSDETLGNQRQRGSLGTKGIGGFHFSKRKDAQ